MKFSVGVLLAVFVVIHGAAIDEGSEEPISRFVVAPTMLFNQAWRYQNLLQQLQLDINAALAAIRTSVSTALTTSTNVTLAQIESNAKLILALDEPARDAIFAMRSSSCINGLKVLLNGVTEFTGFGSANCVTAYDRSVQGAVTSAHALLQKYEQSFGSVLQIVVKSFVGHNVFLESDEIEAIFKKKYEESSADWEEIRPDVESFLRTLQENIAVFNTVLGRCFKTIQDDVAPGYVKLQAEIATCEAFDNTADPFAAFRQ